MQNVRVLNTFYFNLFPIKTRLYKYDNTAADLENPYRIFMFFK